MLRKTLIHASIIWISIILPISLGITGKYYSNILITAITLYTSRKNNLSAFISCFVILIFSLYVPIGISYGKPQNGFIVSIIQTNTRESLEFIQSIPAKSWIVSISLIASVFAFFKTRSRGKTNLWFLLLFATLSVNAYTTRIIKKTISGYIYVQEEMRSIKSSLAVKDSWDIIENKKKFDNIVIVVGESVTSRYMSLYGYDKETTPWLNKADGIFVDGYISTAPYTMFSLPRTLSISNGENIQSNNNIINLLNKAGYDTYWISNQGFISDIDSPITKIAMNARHTAFLKSGDYESKKTDDTMMIPLLADALKNKNKKAIFLHMIGSHPDPCKRLNSAPVKKYGKNPEKINCYLSSIRRLDTFLQKINDMLGSENQSYLLVYFSDHGLTIDDTPPYVRHGNNVKQDYMIPLLFISNKYKKHIVLKREMSAFDFINIINGLIGLSTSQAPGKNIVTDRFDTSHVFNGSRMVTFNELPDLPLK